MRNIDSKAVALFGGSFDPPHIGHIAIVEALKELDYIDKVVIMPTFLNPFKSSSHASSELRFKWLSEIFKDSKKVEVSKFEINKNRPVYAIESVEYLLKKFKRVYLVIGADNLELLSKWHNYEKLQTLVTFVVASRDNINIGKEFIKLNVQENISSTKLRNKLISAQIPKICASEIKKTYKEKNEK